MAIYRRSSTVILFLLRLPQFSMSTGRCVAYDLEKNGAYSHSAWTRALGALDTLGLKPYLVFCKGCSDSAFDREPLLDRHDQDEHGHALDVYVEADVPKGIGSDQPSETEQEMECQVGVNDPEKHPCPNPPIWRFKWVLSSGGNTIDEGSSKTAGGGWINSVTGLNLNLGQFKTDAGHRYQFDLDVLFDNRDPRITNPRLMIAAGGQPAASSMFISGVLGVICTAIASVGGLMVLGSLIHQWSKRMRKKGLAEI